MKLRGSDTASQPHWFILARLWDLYCQAQKSAHALAHKSALYYEVHPETDAVFK